MQIGTNTDVEFSKKPVGTWLEPVNSANTSTLRPVMRCAFKSERAQPRDIHTSVTAKPICG
jgi:hypothetical protein